MVYMSMDGVYDVVDSSIYWYSISPPVEIESRNDSYTNSNHLLCSWVSSCVP